MRNVVRLAGYVAPHFLRYQSPHVPHDYSVPASNTEYPRKEGCVPFARHNDCSAAVPTNDLLIPMLPMIPVQPQTRLFQPSLLADWPRNGSLAM